MGQKEERVVEFLAIFREVPDPRVERTRVHPLINILTIALR